MAGVPAYQAARRGPGNMTPPDFFGLRPRDLGDIGTA